MKQQVKDFIFIDAKTGMFKRREYVRDMGASYHMFFDTPNALEAFSVPTAEEALIMMHGVRSPTCGHWIRPPAELGDVTVHERIIDIEVM